MKRDLSIGRHVRVPVGKCSPVGKKPVFSIKGLAGGLIAGLLFFMVVLWTVAWSGYASDINGDRSAITVYGEYPVVEELGTGRFQDRAIEHQVPLIKYDRGADPEDKALIEALHILSANVYGYTFSYRPGSSLMKTEERFDVALRGELGDANIKQMVGGVRGTVYHVKLVFPVSPSAARWMSAFRSNTLRSVEAEGTSDFYMGWEGRNDALREALRNLVLVAAKKRLHSKPLLIEGDILLDGTPEFSVGAGRHYCRVRGYVNMTNVVTYD